MTTPQQRYYGKNRSVINTAKRAARRENPAKASLTDRRDKGYPMPTRPEPQFCECCGGPPLGRRKHLDLDHDHVTGEFRGWLCGRCNRAIGMLGDTVNGLLRAVRYLTARSP